jgi:hypothetical protein
MLPAGATKDEIFARTDQIVGVQNVSFDKNAQAFCRRPDLINDPQWNQHIGLVSKYGYKCGLDIYASFLITRA